jgi:hypothetical protein
MFHVKRGEGGMGEIFEPGVPGNLDDVLRRTFKPHPTPDTSGEPKFDSEGNIRITRNGTEYVISPDNKRINSRSVDQSGTV